MAYEIKHKSPTECRIAYIEGGQSGGFKAINLPALLAVVIAVLIGIDTEAVIAVYIVYVVYRGIKKTGPRRTLFEIELSRDKNLISVKKPQEDKADAMIYPLNSFMGFGLFKLPPGKKKKGRAMADLFFIFDDDIDKNFIISENSLLDNATQVSGENGHAFWHVPIQKRHRPTLLWRARKIIGTVDNWLGIPIPDPVEEEPVREPEILRDFRDM